MNNYLNYESYCNKVKKVNDEYWNRSYPARWEYIEPVISELKTISPKTAIELGSYKISLMGFSKLEHEGEEYWIGPENQVLGRLVEEFNEVPF